MIIIIKFGGKRTKKKERGG